VANFPFPIVTLKLMPRHANRGRPRDLDRPPEEAYDRLKWHEQYICYQYWNYRATRGKEGWNPIEAGSVHHQRSSTYLLSDDDCFRESTLNRGYISPLEGTNSVLTTSHPSFFKRAQRTGYLAVQDISVLQLALVLRVGSGNKLLTRASGQSP
jgi:hypothetical protein